MEAVSNNAPDVAQINSFVAELQAQTDAKRSPEYAEAARAQWGRPVGSEKKAMLQVDPGNGGDLQVAVQDSLIPQATASTTGVPLHAQEQISATPKRTRRPSKEEKPTVTATPQEGISFSIDVRPNGAVRVEVKAQPVMAMELEALKGLHQTIDRIIRMMEALS